MMAQNKARSNRPNLVLFGPPGAGKGTLASRLFGEGNNENIPYLATGDHLRSLVSGGHPQASMIAERMRAGELVSDEFIIAEVDHFFDEGIFDDGFMLDGFPRTVPQAEYLEVKLEERHLGSLDAVVYITVSDSTVFERLTTRRVCSGCGKIYNTISDPPPDSGACDACGGRIVQRSDDTEETIRQRLEVYRRQTGPIIQLFRDRNLLVQVDGERGSSHVVPTVRSRLAEGGATSVGSDRG